MDRTMGGGGNGLELCGTQELALLSRLIALNLRLAWLGEN